MYANGCNVTHAIELRKWLAFEWKCGGWPATDVTADVTIWRICRVTLPSLYGLGMHDKCATYCPELYNFISIWMNVWCETPPHRRYSIVFLNRSTDGSSCETFIELKKHRELCGHRILAANCQTATHANYIKSRNLKKKMFFHSRPISIG